MAGVEAYPVIKINIDAVVQPVKRTKVLIKISYAKGTNGHAKKKNKILAKAGHEIALHSTACKPRHKRLKQTGSFPSSLTKKSYQQ